MLPWCLASAPRQTPTTSESMASAAARERYARKNEQDELERAFRTIDKKGDNKIDADELNQLFLALGHKVRRRQGSGLGHVPGPPRQRRTRGAAHAVAIRTDARSRRRSEGKWRT